MKKFLILFAAFMLTLTLTGCANDAEELPEIPAEVTMDTVDDFLGRPDVQYVDLRNFDDKMKSGYIAGFEFIPFFDYLEATDVLVRTDGNWDFAAADIMSAAGLQELFDEDKTIFLMCGSGTRAGYVLAALESLGYENVINVGGISNYAGDNMVAGDGSYNLEVQLPLPSVVDMMNIDMYLGRNDVQYVDLRNFDDKMKSGYIAGFEFIPFFDYLELENILVRGTGWDFTAADIKSEAGLRGLFDETAGAIFLMCGSGTRAGYVMDALESLGYTNVINVGGIGTYTADTDAVNLVEGDGSYRLNADVSGPYTPGVYFGFDPIGGYIAEITINAHGGIASVTLDALANGSTKQALGFAYNMKLFSGGDYEWFEHANMLADYIVANQGWGDIVLDETPIDPTWNINTVPHHFINIDNAASPDAVAGVTIGAEGFVLAWNAAIAQASDSDLGVVSITATPETWAAAHAGLADGIYLGVDEATGYMARVHVVEGVLTEVFFDATYAVFLVCEVNGVEDAGIAKGDCGDDAGEVGIYNYTTKQVLQDAYTLGSGTTWAAEADELAAAVLAANGWDPLWVIIEGGEGEHDDFDMTDTYTADAVGGVTIGMEGFKAAFENALAQAEGH